MTRDALARQRRFVLIVALVAAVCSLVGYVGVDHALAHFLHDAGWEHPAAIDVPSDFIDRIAILIAPKYVFGAVLAALGALIALKRDWRPHGVALAFAGALQDLNVLLSGWIKVAFGRMRPFQLLQSGDWGHEWFAGGTSFPSGHIAWYWGLFLPLAFAYPRWRWPLLIVPLFYAVARELDAMHFVSDVGVAIVVVSLTVLAVGTPLARWLPLSASTNR